MCEETCVEWSTCINGNCVCDVDAPHITHKCIRKLNFFLYHVDTIRSE